MHCMHQITARSASYDSRYIAYVRFAAQLTWSFGRPPPLHAKCPAFSQAVGGNSKMVRPIELLPSKKLPSRPES